MEKVAASVFKKLSLNDKYQLLKQRGNFIASRFHGGHNCHLFAFDGYYVEIFKVMVLNQIQWIEVVENYRTLDNYLDNI
jgi:hypothetical protein